MTLSTLFQPPKTLIFSSSSSSSFRLLCFRPTSYLPLTLKFSVSHKLSITISHTPPRFYRFQASSTQQDGPFFTDTSVHNEAKEAVSEMLKKFGASETDSVKISSSCPRYLKMLVDGVSELDELSLWNSRRRGEKEGNLEDGPLSFKEKLWYLAEEKGDNGKVPFLEGIGLSLSSAMNVARYLNAETLPALIHKVKYMKEILFSDSDDEGNISNNARRMMMYLSIPIDDDIQQTLSFFEKIEAKRGGLDLLNSKDTSFRCLLESFPRILLLSIESHIRPMMELLEDIGVSRGCIRNVLLLFPPLLFYKIEKDLRPRMLPYKKICAVDIDFGKMLLKYPWILSMSIQENYEEICSFFEIQKVPKESVEDAIRSWPVILGCSTSKLKLMVEQINDMVADNKKLGHVIATSPQLLLRKPQQFMEVVLFFEELGFDTETVGKIISRCPEIFATNIEKTLKKKLAFLTGMGISGDHLPRVIRKYPEVFICDVDNTLTPRVKYLRKTGLSKRDIAFMIRGFSPLLGYSVEEVLKPKLEFLRNTMARPVRDVVHYPRYFSYSLEKKIKPRYWVLKSRNVECSLKEMLAKNDEEFAAEFMGTERMLMPPSPPASR